MNGDLVSNYVKENEGSGFELDEDDDFESMLAQASNAGDQALAEEEDDDNDFINRALGNTPREEQFEQAPPTPSSRREQRNQPPVQRVAEPTPAPAYEEQEEAYEEPIEVMVPSYREPEPTPVEDNSFSKPIEPIQPSREPARNVSNSNSNNRARIVVPSEAEEIARADKIIKVSDVYRSLDEKTKPIVGQIISYGEDIGDSEAAVIIKAINADPIIFTTMETLRQAKDEIDTVERVFYILNQEDRILYSVGQLIESFTGEEIERNQPKLAYAKKLVNEINTLDKKAIDFVIATERLLAAAKD